MDFNQPPLSVNVDPMEEADPGATESEVRMGCVPPGAHGERLDKALVQMLPEFSRSHVQHLIAQGCVSDPPQTLTKASMRVKAGQPLRIELRPTEESQAFLPQDLPIETVYVDDHLRVTPSQVDEDSGQHLDPDHLAGGDAHGAGQRLAVATGPSRQGRRGRRDGAGVRGEVERGVGRDQAAG